MKQPITSKPEWRTNAFFFLSEDTTLPGVGQIAKKGTLANTVASIKLSRQKELTIPIPNVAAILLNAAYNAAEKANDIRKNSLIDVAGKRFVQFQSDSIAFDYLEFHLESIVLSYSAIEAFANSIIPDDYQYVRHGRSNIILDADSKERIEKTYSTEDKLCQVLPEVLQCKTPKGSKLWQSFRQMKKARDKIIHPKSAESRYIQNETGSIWEAAFESKTPHICAKELITHFANSINPKPYWLTNFRSITPTHG